MTRPPVRETFGRLYAAKPQHDLCSDRAPLITRRTNEGETPTLVIRAARRSSFAVVNQFWTNLTPMIVAAGYNLASLHRRGHPGDAFGNANRILRVCAGVAAGKAAGGPGVTTLTTIGYTTDVAAGDLATRCAIANFYSYSPRLSRFEHHDADSSRAASMQRAPKHLGLHARAAGDYERWLNWFDAHCSRTRISCCTLLRTAILEGGLRLIWNTIAGWLKNYLLGPGGLRRA